MTFLVDFKNEIRFFCLDVKLLEQWYLLDDKLSPPVYKLKDPDESFSNILSRSVSTYDLNTRENQEWNEAYVNLVDLFLSVLHDKSNVKSIHDIQLLSGVEMLFNFSTKLSSSGCMCVSRQFDGMFRDLSNYENCFKKFVFSPPISVIKKSLDILTSHLDRLTTLVCISFLIYIHHKIYYIFCLLRRLL